jgi:hypothetical protein
MIEAAGALPPGPEAWTPILQVFGDDIGVRELANLFRVAFGERWVRESGFDWPEHGARQDLLNACRRHADALDASAERSGL